MFTHIFWFLRFIFLLFLSFYFPFLTIKIYQKNNYNTNTNQIAKQSKSCCVFSKPKKNNIIKQTQIKWKKWKKKSSAWIFLCTALRRSHINFRWYQNTELAINRPTCLLLIQNQWHNACVCLCLLKINNNSNTIGGSTTNTQTTVLVIDLPNIKKFIP